jgi:hypothetical protein
VAWKWLTPPCALAGHATANCGAAASVHQAREHSLFGFVPGGDQSAEHGAGAAAHHQVGTQAFANQHFHHAQCGDAAPAAAAQHDGEAVLGE